VARHDYLPFGEEIPNGVAGRSSSPGPFGGGTTMTQMFTGQERDGGTATLDYFNARHLSAVLGSMMQPDPMNAGGDILNPQSWNAYGYVLGNPLGLVDPSGMCSLGGDGYYHGDDDGPCVAPGNNSVSVDGGSVDEISLVWVLSGSSAGGSSPPGAANLPPVRRLSIPLQLPTAPNKVCSEDGPHIVRDASVNALSHLNPGQDESTNITPRDGNFANVVNPSLINTKTWTGAASAHGTSRQSPTIPGQSIFVVKLYNDPKRGNIIAVVYPNGTMPHMTGLIPFMAGSTSVNVPAARTYMGCR